MIRLFMVLTLVCFLTSCSIPVTDLEIGEQKRVIESVAVMESVETTATDFLSKNYSEQLSISLTQDEKAVPVKNIIKGFIEQNEEFIKGYSIHELTEKLYSDMIGFSFLEKYIKDEDVEEILINSSDSIEIITSKGREKVSDMFSSPDVALNILHLHKISIFN